jgi:hypothetical protein
MIGRFLAFGTVTDKAGDTSFASSFSEGTSATFSAAQVRSDTDFEVTDELDFTESDENGWARKGSR